MMGTPLQVGRMRTHIINAFASAPPLRAPTRQSISINGILISIENAISQTLVRRIDSLVSNGSMSSQGASITVGRWVKRPHMVHNAPMPIVLPSTISGHEPARVSSQVGLPMTWMHTHEKAAKAVPHVAMSAPLI